MRPLRAPIQPNRGGDAKLDRTPNRLPLSVSGSLSRRVSPGLARRIRSAVNQETPPDFPNTKQWTHPLSILDDLGLQLGDPALDAWGHLARGSVGTGGALMEPRPAVGPVAANPLPDGPDAHPEGGGRPGRGPAVLEDPLDEANTPGQPQARVRMGVHEALEGSEVERSPPQRTVLRGPTPASATVNNVSGNYT